MRKLYERSRGNNWLLISFGMKSCSINSGIAKDHKTMTKKLASTCVICTFYYFPYNIGLFSNVVNSQNPQDEYHIYFINN